MDAVQVEKTHYLFSKYMTKGRWSSIWHQLSIISKLDPDSILEVGPGLGVLKAVGALYGFTVTTVDIDPGLEPDYVGGVTNLPFKDEAFDLICAFQVLEHLPYSELNKALRDLKRVTSKYVLISLPNADVVWRYKVYVPKLGEYDFMISRPFRKPAEHMFDGEHYWELNKKGYDLNRVLSDFSREFIVKDNWQLWDNPYHHFFLLEKLV